MRSDDDHSTSTGRDLDAVAARRGRSDHPSRVRAVAAQPPPLAEFQGQPPGLLVVLDLHDPVRGLVVCRTASPTTGRSSIKYDGHLYWPAYFSYSETTFGGDFETAADYRDPYLQKQIADKGGTIVWPLIRYSYDTHNLDLPTPAPSKPTWMLTETAVQRGGAEEASQRLPRPRIQLARHRRPGPRRGGAPDLRLPDLGIVRSHADDRVLDHRRRRGRRAGLFRRPDRFAVSAIHRSLERDPLAVSAPDHIGGAAARLLHPARHPDAVFMGIAGGPGARRIPARPQFRIHHGGARARRLQRRDHVPPSAAERDGGDHDVPALHRVVVGDDADGAGFPRLRPAAGLAVAR